MTKNIISLILLVTTVGLHLKHGIDAFHTPTVQQLNMAAKLGLSESQIPFIGVGIILLSLLLVIPKTYFVGNILNALAVLMIIVSAIINANYKMVLFEIPFLIIPFLMIWLKYPFINSKTDIRNQPK